MMEFIAHRINTKAELAEVDSKYGVEVDLRDGTDGRIYMQHDPFVKGEDFEEYLKEYHHGTMILNVKSERIEYKVIELLRKYYVNKYFFLDSTFPMIKALSDGGERNIALRFSEFEGMDTLKAMQGKVDWVWVDCFTEFPLDKKMYECVKDMGYKVCIVSPELQGHKNQIKEYRKMIYGEEIQPNAVCSKVYNFKLWIK